jgi:hypothetical protein
MKDKGHFITSIIKSVVRIISCIGAIIAKDALVLAAGFLLAEILGIIEEVADKR